MKLQAAIDSVSIVRFPPTTTGMTRDNNFRHAEGSGHLKSNSRAEGIPLGPKNSLPAREYSYIGRRAGMTRASFSRHARESGHLKLDSRQKLRE
jgi:hypothetical protein